MAIGEMDAYEEGKGDEGNEERRGEIKVSRWSCLRVRETIRRYVLGDDVIKIRGRGAGPFRAVKCGPNDLRRQ